MVQTRTASLVAALTELRDRLAGVRLPLTCPMPRAPGRRPGARSGSSTTTCCRGSAGSTRRCSSSWAAPPGPASRPW
ncbi:hypothetical protein ACFQX7_14800 [Luedemannella flava]